jgi:DNA-binding transcriptional ArsR family regulator
MFKELLLRCPNDFTREMSTFQSLVKMQHYTLPTRMLDLTSNPLVALYFACATDSEDDQDGEVIVLGFDVDEVKYFDSDTVSVIANLSRQPSDFRVPATNDLKEFNEDEQIKLLLHDVRQDKPHFDPRIRPNDLGKVVCVKPRLDNPRIIRQDGAFLLFGVDQEKKRAARLDEHSVIERIRISRDKKKKITTKLETLGISKATMFPEIEQVATHIKRHYEVPKLDLSKMKGIQVRIFDVLIRNGALCIRDLAESLGIAPNSARHWISKLYEDGLIESVGSGRNLKWQVKDAVKALQKQSSGSFPLASD